MTIDADTVGRPERPGRPPRPSQPERPGRAAALPPDERRAAIITATIPLLREHGRAVTTRQIAEAATIAEGTIFRVFTSKDDLIEATITHALDEDETIDAIRALDASAPLTETIRACAEILCERMNSVIDLMMALHRPGNDEAPSDRGGTHPTHPHRHRRRAPDDPAHRAVLDAIADLLAPHADELACGPDRAAHLLRVMVFAGTRPMGRVGVALGADEITDVLLHGIARHPAPAPDAGPSPDGAPRPDSGLSPDSGTSPHSGTRPGGTSHTARKD